MIRLSLLAVFALTSLCAAQVPKTVKELWADFDPRKDPLEAEVISEWKADGLVLRKVRFLVGAFKGKPARLAAFYGFPEGTKGKLPAVMHIHGGGQRANLNEVQALAARGYAALSVNWGGREMEDAKPGELNTDWGAVDPTQQNVPGYNSMLPGPKQFFEDREHPKNCNWYLLTVACRRGLTFLEQQPEVDATRMGIHGFSMGGNLTMYVAGTDDRVKAAVPGVGGQGWRWEPHQFIGGEAQQEKPVGDLEVFRNTLSFESYAPLIRCPVFHRSGTNDFHGWMDDVYRTNALIPGQPVRYSWSPHLNHRLIPEVSIGMFLWLDQYLKGGPALPETSGGELLLGEGKASFKVTPKASWPVARCEIFYSVDPDPRARFWRSAEVRREQDVFTAELTRLSEERTVFAFANVYHTLPKADAVPQLPDLRTRTLTEVCLSTLIYRASPEELKSVSVRNTEKPSLLIEDFSHGWRDWYRLNQGNPDHWENFTRKVTDPQWRGPEGAKLAITLKLPETNKMVFTVIENEWRSYRGQRQQYICEKEIPGNPEAQTVVLELADFKSVPGGKSPASWSQMDQLGLLAHYSPGAPNSEVRRWKGKQPEFIRLEWKL